jgi:hypothetical protein
MELRQYIRIVRARIGPRRYHHWVASVSFGAAASLSLRYQASGGLRLILVIERVVEQMLDTWPVIQQGSSLSFS